MRLLYLLAALLAGIFLIGRHIHITWAQRRKRIISELLKSVTSDLLANKGREILRFGRMTRETGFILENKMLVLEYSPETIDCSAFIIFTVHNRCIAVYRNSREQEMLWSEFMFACQWGFLIYQGTENHRCLTKIFEMAGEAARLEET